MYTHRGIFSSGYVVPKMVAMPGRFMKRQSLVPSRMRMQTSNLFRPHNDTDAQVWTLKIIGHLKLETGSLSRLRFAKPAKTSLS